MLLWLFACVREDFGFNKSLRVPFPVDKNNKNRIAMLDITKFNVKSFINNTKDLKPQMKNMYRTFSYDCDSFSLSAKPLKVHDVGNYKISIAHSIQDVINRVDWNVFHKPPNFNVRVNTLSNKQLYPDNYDWIYVVAMATTDIEDDGFGILYPSDKIDYFPIAHEFKDDYINKVDYDVDLFYYSTKNGNGVKIGPLNKSAYIVDDKNKLQNILTELDKLSVIYEDGKKDKIKTNDNISYCNIYMMEGNGPNINIYFNK